MIVINYINKLQPAFTQNRAFGTEETKQNATHVCVATDSTQFRCDLHTNSSAPRGPFCAIHVRSHDLRHVHTFLQRLMVSSVLEVYQTSCHAGLLERQLEGVTNNVAAPGRSALVVQIFFVCAHCIKSINKYMTRMW
jgi:hypothetical protein